MAQRRPYRGGIVRSLLGYAALRARGLARFPSPEERGLNQRLRGYPGNHHYRICRGQMIPGFQLYDRFARIAALYPERLESFLDVGCCRGFFVLEAAQRASCRVAMGADVHEPFIAAADGARRQLGIDRAAFHLADLETVARNPASWGGPFQTVMLVGTYHYLYWGSHLCPTAFHDHRAILSRLAAVCTGELIFSARLEVARLPRWQRASAAATPHAAGYTEPEFLAAAAEYFEADAAGRLGRDRLWLMSRRGRS